MKKNTYNNLMGYLKLLKKLLDYHFQHKYFYLDEFNKLFQLLYSNSHLFTNQMIMVNFKLLNLNYGHKK